RRRSACWASRKLIPVPLRRRRVKSPRVPRLTSRHSRHVEVKSHRPVRKTGQVPLSPTRSPDAPYRNVTPTITSLRALPGPALPGKALVERTKIDHDSLVGSATDLLFAIACRHLEANSPSFDTDDLGRRTYLVADRRCGE